MDIVDYHKNESIRIKRLLTNQSPVTFGGRQTDALDSFIKSLSTLGYGPRVLFFMRRSAA